MWEGNIMGKRNLFFIYTTQHTQGENNWDFEAYYICNPICFPNIKNSSWYKRLLFCFTTYFILIEIHENLAFWLETNNYRECNLIFNLLSYLKLEITALKSDNKFVKKMGVSACPLDFNFPSIIPNTNLLPSFALFPSHICSFCHDFSTISFCCQNSLSLFIHFISSTSSPGFLLHPSFPISDPSLQTLLGFTLANSSAFLPNSASFLIVKHTEWRMNPRTITTYEWTIFWWCMYYI